MDTGKDTTLEQPPPARSELPAEGERKSAQLELLRVREEFNQQRARMKELYLAKESECKRLALEVSNTRKELDELKAQMMIIEYSREKDAEEHQNKKENENRTLKQLVNDTLDESSVMRDSLKQLREENVKLASEVVQLKEELAYTNQVSPSLAKTVQQAKRIILKLGTADSTGDNLEESMRKVKKYAQEDAEVLRSLVVPLEEEIKSLKEKLRIAYEEIETYNNCNGRKLQESALIGMLNPRRVADVSSVSTPDPVGSDQEGIQKTSVTTDHCERCRTLEATYTLDLKGERMRATSCEKSLERLKEQLTKETALRSDLEVQWHKKREEHKIKVQELVDRASNTEVALEKLRCDYAHLKLVLREELQKVTEEREQVYYQLNNLQQDNDFLAGKYLASSEALKDKDINFPQTIEELQELVLALHENLIVTKAGCEFAEQKARSMQDEVTLLQEQQCCRDRDVKKAELEYARKHHHLLEQLKCQQHDFEHLTAIREDLERADVEHKKQNSELRMQIIELQAANERSDKQNSDLKSKIAVLQEDLANNEAVQKDFVKLSQSLQMQLEKIRSADTQVRWQDEDDVNQCPNCKKEFTVTRRKQHCRHCGSIYCQPCLTKSVPSGPNRKAARVCDVCHTLLVQDTAPYFSREPPQSP
ncbi:rab GTPase-binding effector protein 1 isoform X1 [Anopheles bellator]|uniref:rab GTPase-binding effector protein 1 isoform X1 n=1 Tax=Anopheles bellator TaxID=139047 RepID=UPI002649C9B4|nr:rab GTPase-binding effector protein 1 isoform X1 [Anopheles bellator]